MRVLKPDFQMKKDYGQSAYTVFWVWVWWVWSHKSHAISISLHSQITMCQKVSISGLHKTPQEPFKTIILQKIVWQMLSTESITIRLLRDSCYIKTNKYHMHNWSMCPCIDTLCINRYIYRYIYMYIYVDIYTDIYRSIYDVNSEKYNHM